MGISHCTITLAGFLMLSPRKDHFFSWIVAVTLAVECSMAWLFSRVANPEEGVFFASGDPEFATINTYTLVVIAIAYPSLIAAFIKMKKRGTNDSAIKI